MILFNILILLLCELLLSIHLSSAQILQTTTVSGSFPAQCYSYTPVDDASRNINAVGSSGCDTMFMSGSVWYRFIGASGTQISTSPTGPNHCGTQVTGWYAGYMPSVSETITSGRMCFAWENNNCQWSNTIAVTNCGSYYVYQLTMPPVCSARYCTDTSIIDTTVIPTTALPTSALSPQCYNYTTMDDPTRSVNQTTTSSKTCDQSFFTSNPTWVRFVGVGGTQIPTSAVGPNRCGTDATGWYSGEMPSALDATTNGTVCFAWQSNTCNWNTNALVTDCGSYYVYRLTAPKQCSLRYCTDTPTNPITTTTEVATSTMLMTASQCYNYTTIDDPTRNINEGRGNDADQTYFSSGPRWVRFVGSGGTEIPTSAIAIYRCGTSASGWYSGTMPTTPDTTTSGTACFTWTQGNCAYENQIQVTHCGSYYVYYLSAPSTGGMRYCTTNSTITNLASGSTTVLSTISNFFRNLFKKIMS